MSEFYDEMYDVASELLEEFGTDGVLTSLDGTLDFNIKIAYLRPDRKRDDMALERSYLTDSTMKRGIFQFEDRNIFTPERGCIISSGGRSMSINSISEVAPANETVIYECLLEI